MEIKRGIAVSPGVAIGPALLLDTEWFRIPQRYVEAEQVADEIVRLREALEAAARETRDTQEAVNAKLGARYGAIFGAHAMMLTDPTLEGEITAHIRDKGFAAEYAVSRVMRRYAKALESINGGHLATRVADIFDLEKRILSCLLGQRREQLTRLTESVVVLAHDLTPSETASLDPKHVHAFATEAGGRTSHTAIVAGVLEIPAVVGSVRSPRMYPAAISSLWTAIKVCLSSTRTRRRWLYTNARAATSIAIEARLNELRDLPAVTRDGVRIQLFGNIEFPTECTHCLDRGGEGVGLYRTEFLYLGKKADPSEEEHLEAYLSVLKALGPKRPLVIRTLDLGADKFQASHGRGPPRAQSVPRFAQRAALFAEFALVQNADACHSEGQCFRGRPRDVPHDKHHAGTAPVQDDPGRGQRRP